MTDLAEFLLARVGGVAVRIGRDIWQGHLHAWRAIGAFLAYHGGTLVAIAVGVVAWFAATR